MAKGYSYKEMIKSEELRTEDMDAVRELIIEEERLETDRVVAERARRSRGLRPHLHTRAQELS